MPTLYWTVNETGNRNRILERCKFRFWLVHWIDPRSIEHNYACIVFVSVLLLRYVWYGMHRPNVFGRSLALTWTRMSFADMSVHDVSHHYGRLRSRCGHYIFVLFMAALWNRAVHYIFALWFLSSSSSIFLFPRLISAVGHWMLLLRYV